MSAARPRHLIPVSAGTCHAREGRQDRRRDSGASRQPPSVAAGQGHGWRRRASSRAGGQARCAPRAGAGTSARRVNGGVIGVCEPTLTRIARQLEAAEAGRARKRGPCRGCTSPGPRADRRRSIPHTRYRRQRPSCRAGSFPARHADSCGATHRLKHGAARRELVTAKRIDARVAPILDARDEARNAGDESRRRCARRAARADEQSLRVHRAGKRLS